MIVFFAELLDWSKASPGFCGLSAIVAEVYLMPPGEPQGRTRDKIYK